MAGLYYKGKSGVVVREQGDRLILVVEENDTVRKALARLLFDLGIFADTSADGIETEERASTGAYELILMDMSMPGIDGYETARRIREHELISQRNRTPIIAVTTSPNPNAASESAVDDWVCKPLELKKLAPILDHWLNPGLRTVRHAA